MYQRLEGPPVQGVEQPAFRVALEGVLNLSLSGERTSVSAALTLDAAKRCHVAHFYIQPR
ncbi:hypothetical protein REMIM1_PE00506 (plasmid) [Rhizobium etli bv. mimosae str. Mim1]|nr:hypothetical protein REMIM1_PE00506 [Rhizobium etli bv. mimosae str. Mim1]